FFFFQAEDGIRYFHVTGVQTCALPISVAGASPTKADVLSAMVTTMNRVNGVYERELSVSMVLIGNNDDVIYITSTDPFNNSNGEIGRASCRERHKMVVVAVTITEID